LSKVKEPFCEMQNGSFSLPEKASQIFAAAAAKQSSIIFGATCA
jgi:hypothetical protein